MNDSYPQKTVSPPSAPEAAPKPIPYARLSITGLFMGLANLVPGVSGGTMVLVLGLYEEFIGAFSDLTRLRFSRRALIVVAMLFGISAVTIFLFAGGIQFLMEMFLPGMLGLFIGMTLGGAPLLYREMRPLGAVNVFSAALGFAVMAVVAALRPDTTDTNWLLFFVGGIVGSSAMILPGISGSYMLLILGLYMPIIAAISQFMDAIVARDLGVLVAAGSGVILPVGLGVLIGLALLSNLLRFLLRRYHRPTIGFLMGLLLGSVLGLYPFKETRFDKLPRYAVEAPEGGKRVLRVIGAGWTASADSPVYRNLMLLESREIALEFETSQNEVDKALVDRAREKKAVLIAYDTDVPNEARRHAGKDVQLLIVANTQFTVPKLWLVLGLTIVGFFTTFLLGRFGEEKA